ncbi:hypothetical protein ACFPH6_08780 [Streptomyces xiangluensis]|uniref:Secreted protein n=1 Tax=Streptomyces xiangluensis TaxID=2665720 RepID=A0ABV8YIQ1_9ACTN
MTRMDQGLAALIAAVVAGLLALGGAWIGFLGARRQTTDQAHAAHDQWLREQRQQAYVVLLDAWDQAVGGLDHLVDEWNDVMLAMDGQGEAHEFHEYIVNRADKAGAVVQQPLDRVALLGPEQIDVAAERMDTAIRSAQYWLGILSRPDARDRDWASHWPDTMDGFRQARAAFMALAKDELRRVPRPGRKP